MNIGGIIGLVFSVLFILVGGVGGCMWGAPQYSVYSQRLAGEAELARAESTKRTMVEQARAKMDAAALEAQAEVARAKGVAEANRIIADGLGGPEGYLRYLYINALSENADKGRQVIYVPTEAGLPILEAGRATAPEPKR
ncbi:membrane protease subunit [Xanthobacter sp.]|uniref:membrane protease subunit n=1 Tax=Xanthobacter sp. TaxID=35809 RepID=UPI0025CEEC4A|nr:membrane protease subunit [Xanthobacter sp.]